MSRQHRSEDLHRGENSPRSEDQDRAGHADDPAKDLHRTPVTAIPATPYGAFRRHLETGDLLFGSGRSLLSRMVRMATHSPWSHVGIIVRLEAWDRVLLLESRNAGVRLTPLSRYFDEGQPASRYDGDLVVARHTELDPRSAAAQALIGYGLDLLASPQGVGGSLGIALRMMLGCGSIAERRRGFVCSEFVDACFAHPQGGGFHPFSRAKARFVSPADIWSDPRVMPIRRLVAAP